MACGSCPGRAQFDSGPSASLHRGVDVGVESRASGEERFVLPQADSPLAPVVTGHWQDRPLVLQRVDIHDQTIRARVTVAIF
jgi:hypothetical protein